MKDLLNLVREKLDYCLTQINYLLKIWDVVNAFRTRMEDKVRWKKNKKIDEVLTYNLNNLEKCGNISCKNIIINRENPFDSFYFRVEYLLAPQKNRCNSLSFNKMLTEYIPKLNIVDRELFQN